MIRRPPESKQTEAVLPLANRFRSPGGARRLALDPLAHDLLVLGTTLGAPAPESSAQSLPGRRVLLAESLVEALSEARSERARETGREPDRTSTRLNSSP